MGEWSEVGGTVKVEPDEATANGSSKLPAAGGASPAADLAREGAQPQFGLATPRVRRRGKQGATPAPRSSGGGEATFEKQLG